MYTFFIKIISFYPHTEVYISIWYIIYYGSIFHVKLNLYTLQYTSWLQTLKHINIKLNVQIKLFYLSFLSIFDYFKVAHFVRTFYKFLIVTHYQSLQTIFCILMSFFIIHYLLRFFLWFFYTLDINACTRILLNFLYVHSHLSPTIDTLEPHKNVPTYILQ